MWTRQRPEQHSDDEEKQARERLLTLLQGKESAKDPDPSHWQDLIVRTNHRIDGVASVKAISISWVARVAIPGAVAILFFFIGLHYYAPEREPDQASVAELVAGLPAASQDSLVDHLLERAGPSDARVVFYDNLLELSEAEMYQYLSEVGNTGMLLRTLPEDQIGQLVSLLQTRKRNSLL